MSTVLLLWRRKWIVLSATVVSVLVAGVITLRMPNTYVATSSVLIIRPEALKGSPSAPPSAETYKEIATTPAVVAGALERSGNPAAPDGTPWSVDRARRRMRVDTHEERGQYNSIRISPLLELSVRDTDPERAAALANAWAESFREVSRRFQGENSSQLARVLTERTASLAERLLAAEEAYRTFQRESMLALLEAEARGQAEALAAARTTRMDLEGRVEERLRMIGSLRTETSVDGGTAAGDGAGAPTGIIGDRLEVAARELETAMQVLRDSRQEMEVAAIDADLVAAQSRLRGYRDLLASVENRQMRALAEVERIEAFLPTATGESDARALRESIAADGTNDPGERVSDLVLLERLQDPALQALRERYFQARVDADALGPLLETYRTRIAELRKEVILLEAEASTRRDGLTLLEERRTRDLANVRNLEQIRVDLRKEIATLQLEATRFSARARAVAEQERAARQEAERLQSNLVDQRLRDEQLRREVEQLRQIHSRLLTRAQEAQAAGAAHASDVALVSHAVAPDRPVSPRTFLNLLVAAVFGAFVSSAFVFLTAGPPRTT